MRELTTHKVNGVNNGLTVTATDEPGSGGANHEYRISGFRKMLPGESDPWVGMDIHFQNGPIAEVGTNGITHEALLAIVIDRLQAFQKGKYACRENALALTKLEEAVHWLKHRTEARAGSRRRRYAYGVSMNTQVELTPPPPAPPVALDMDDRGGERVVGEIVGALVAPMAAIVQSVGNVW